MTRFDEPRRRGSVSLSGSEPLRMRGLAARRPVVAIALLGLTAVAIFLATALVCARFVVPAVLDRAFIGNPVIVYTTPTAPRSETEALGDRLRTLPRVGQAVLRPREDALRALVQAGVPQASDGRNPLPDAWILALRPEDVAHTSFVTAANSLRDAIAALPGVDQVRFDARWNERLEAWSESWVRRGRPLVALGVFLLAVGLAGVWFLAREAILQPVDGAGPDGKQVPTLYVSLLVLAAGFVASAAGWSLISLLAQGSAGPGVEAVTPLRLGSCLAGATAVAALVAWVASRRSTTHSL